MTVKHELLAAFVAAGISDPRIAAHYGVTARTVLRWRTAEGIESLWKPLSTAQHGSVARYNRGCHCTLCRAASTARAARNRAARRARRDENGVAPVEVHGLSTGRNWGCKCAICLAAIDAANRAWAEAH